MYEDCNNRVHSRSMVGVDICYYDFWVKASRISSIQLWRIKAYSCLLLVDVSTPLVTLFGVTAPHIFHSILISHVLTRRVSFMSLNCYVGIREVVTFFCLRIILLHLSHLWSKIGLKKLLRAYVNVNIAFCVYYNITVNNGLNVRY